MQIKSVMYSGNIRPHSHCIIYSVDGAVVGNGSMIPTFLPLLISFDPPPLRLGFSSISSSPTPASQQGAGAGSGLLKLTNGWRSSAEMNGPDTHTKKPSLAKITVASLQPVPSLIVSPLFGGHGTGYTSTTWTTASLRTLSGIGGTRHPNLAGGHLPLSTHRIGVFVFHFGRPDIYFILSFFICVRVVRRAGGACAA